MSTTFEPFDWLRNVTFSNIGCYCCCLLERKGLLLSKERTFGSCWTQAPLDTFFWIRRNFQNYALCGLVMECRDGSRLKRLKQYFVYCEVAKGGVPTVQGGTTTHEGVLKVPLENMVEKVLGPLGLWVGEHLVRGSGFDHFAISHEHYLVRCGSCKSHFMGDKKHRHS